MTIRNIFSLSPKAPGNPHDQGTPLKIIFHIFKKDVPLSLAGNPRLARALIGFCVGSTTALGRT